MDFAHDYGFWVSLLIDVVYERLGDANCESYQSFVLKRGD